MTRRSRPAVVAVVVAVGVAAAVLLAGCTAPTSTRPTAPSSQGSSPGSSTRIVPPTAPSPPIASGSTNAVAGRDADALLAQARRPPRTVQTAAAPAPALARPFSTFDCESAQRSVYWVASGWSLDGLSDWLRENTSNLTLESTGHGTTYGEVSSRSVTLGTVGDALRRNAAALTMLLVPIDGGRVGVRVEAEATPPFPCAGSTVIPATPIPDAAGSTSRHGGLARGRHPLRALRMTGSMRHAQGTPRAQRTHRAQRRIHPPDAPPSAGHGRALLDMGG